MLLRVILSSIAGILLVFSVCFGISTYSYYTSIHADDPITPHLFVEAGNAKIIRGDIAIELTRGEQYDLAPNDAVETSRASRATITWPDRSITRLGENTRVVIHRMYANANYDSIQISLSLQKGKIWTRVVRSLIGDSYFETKLPKNDIVAAVRGTTFEINLENNYIHAVRHNISLSDGFFHHVSLFPGEIVDSENILIKRTKDYLDTTWNSINSLADTLYDEKRLQEINAFIETRKTGILRLWDEFMQSMLGRLQAFRGIQIETLIRTNNIEQLTSFSEEDLFRYYQRIQSGSGNTSIETIRKSLIHKVEGNPQMARYLDVLKRGALWEMIDTNPYTLPTLQSLMDAKSQTEIQQAIQSLQKNLMEKDLQSESIQALQSLLR